MRIWAGIRSGSRTMKIAGIGQNPGEGFLPEIDERKLSPSEARALSE